MLCGSPYYLSNNLVDLKFIANTAANAINVSQKASILKSGKKLKYLLSLSFIEKSNKSGLIVPIATIARPIISIDKLMFAKMNPHRFKRNNPIEETIRPKTDKGEKRRYEYKIFPKSILPKYGLLACKIDMKATECKKACVKDSNPTIIAIILNLFSVICYTHNAGR